MAYFFAGTDSIPVGSATTFRKKRRPPFSILDFLFSDEKSILQWISIPLFHIPTSFPKIRKSEHVPIAAV